MKLKGVKWIKQKYGDELRAIRIGQKGYLDTIETALIKGMLKNYSLCSSFALKTVFFRINSLTGKTVLIENIEETLDPVLDPLLGRNLIKKGK